MEDTNIAVVADSIDDTRPWIPDREYQWQWPGIARAVENLITAVYSQYAVHTPYAISIRQE